MKIYRDVEQKTDEWLNLRKGKMTASHATAIGTAGKGLDTYIIELMSEYFSSGEKEFYSNEHIERGNELEEFAREMYELETGNTVEQVAFIEYNEFVGCSPDGLVGEKGLIEIKCQQDKKHFSLLINGESEIDSGYIWQMQMQMLISGREWCDFVAYNPNFKKSLFIHRVYADQEKHNKLLKGFEVGKQKILELKELYENRMNKA